MFGGLFFRVAGLLIVFASVALCQDESPSPSPSPSLSAVPEPMTIVLSFIEQAEESALRGNYALAADLYTQAASYNTTDPDVQSLCESARLMAFNLKSNRYDAMATSNSSTVTYIDGTDFRDLTDIVQQGIRIVQDYDSQVACLRDIERIDEVFLVQQVEIEQSEVSRHLQELNSTITKQTALLGGLSNELSLLRSKYEEYFKSLSSHMTTAVDAENSKIAELNNEIKDIQDQQRKKSIIGGIFAALQVIGGAVACALGAPELGVPLIIGGVSKAINTAADSLNALSPIEAREEEVRWCQQAIEDLRNLVVDAQKMNQAWITVTEDYDGSSLAEQLPSLYVLTIAGDSFQAYIDAFQSKLIFTAGQAGQDVAVDASMVNQVISLTFVSMNEFYQSKMAAQHAKMEVEIYQKQANELQSLQQEGVESVKLLNRTMSMLGQRRRRVAIDVVKTLSMQRRQFASYTLAFDSAMALEVAYDPDTIALQTMSQSNLKMIMDYDTQQYSIPQTCWTQLTITRESHPHEFDLLVQTGTTQLFLQPPASTENNLQAYNAFVSEVHTYLTAPTLNLGRVKIAVVKGASEMRVAEDGAAHRYLTEPHTVNVVYDHQSQCPLSATTQLESSSTLSNTVKDGRKPALYGMWGIKTQLEDTAWPRVESLTLLFKTHYRVRFPSASSSSAAGESFRLFDAPSATSDAPNDPNWGRCGAVNAKCPYYPDTLGSTQCSLANSKTDADATKEGWEWTIIGFVVVVALLVVMNAWVLWRIRYFEKDREARQARMDALSSVGSTPRDRASGSLMESVLSSAVKLEQGMRRTQDSRKEIKNNTALLHESAP